MWVDFEPPSLPLSNNENNRGSYHNSLPLRMEEEFSIRTILHASCRMGAEQSLVLLLMRMGNGCWCKPIVLTENWGRIRPRQIHFHCYSCHHNFISTSYIIMIIRSQFLSLSSPHPQPQFLIVSTWSWELVRGGGKKSLWQKNVRRCHCDAGSSFLVLLVVCCCVLYYHDISLLYCTDDWRWPHDLKLKFMILKQDCC